MKTYGNHHDLEANVAALEAMDGARSAGVSQHEIGLLLGSRGAAQRGRPDSPFEQVAAVNRCVQIIADSVKGMPLLISTANDQIVESGDVVDLINCPFPGMSGEDMVEWIVALLLLTGSANLVKGDSAGNPIAPGSGPVRSLRPVGGDRVVPHYDHEGRVEYYHYNMPGSRSGFSRLLPDQVIRWTRSNYHSQRFADGLSAIRPAKLAIDQVFGADTANLSSLSVGQAPGLHIKFPQRPTEDQVRDYRQFIKEMHGGPERAGEPLITFDGTEVQPFEKDFSKMLHDKLRQMSITDICVATGVPPAVLGYSHSSALSQGSAEREAHEIFWTMTVLPMAHWIARKITVDVLPAFTGRSWRSLSRTLAESSRVQRCCPTYKASRRHARSFRVPVVGERGVRRLAPVGLFAWFDSSNVPILIESKFRLVEKGALLIDKYEQPAADVIEAHDLPYPIHEHQRTATRAIGRFSVDEPAPLSDEALGVDEDPDRESEGRGDGGACCGGCGLPYGGEAFGFGPVCGNCKTGLGGYRDLEPRVLESVWRAWVVSWDGLRRAAEKKVTRHWIEKRSEVLNKLKSGLPRRDAAAPSSETGRRDLIASILFDLVPDGKGSLVAKLGPIIRQAYELGGNQTMLEAAEAKGEPDPKPFVLDAAPVRESLRRRMVRIHSIDREVRARLGQDADRALRQSVADGLDAEQTAEQIAEAIRKRFGIESGKAGLVARTEVGAAVEDARQAGRSQAGVPLKSWLSSRKPTGRPNHLEMERQTMDRPIAQDQSFVLPETGGRALYPRASTLGAGDVVNCACTTLSRYEGESLRAAVDRYASRGFMTHEQLCRRQSGGKDGRS